MSSPSKLRVIQWATGGVGKAAIECVLNHPQLELTGCWVHSADKNGLDVGQILGTAPLGDTATFLRDTKATPASRSITVDIVRRQGRHRVRTEPPATRASRMLGAQRRQERPRRRSNPRNCSAG